jgi:hypothetical protein
VIDLRVGPRTLETAVQLVASVALCCNGVLPLILMDEHLPYPKAILQVFGHIKYRRRKQGRGRKCKPELKPPPGLLVGVVRKLRDDRGNLLRVSTHALFGRLKDIRKRIKKLRIGKTVNTSHIERLNGTMRCQQQARLARRSRNGSRQTERLQWSMWLWRDAYNWMRVHGSLDGRCPAMVLGLAQRVWSMLDYVRYPTHVCDLQRQEWKNQRTDMLESALDKYMRKKCLPIS